MRSFRVVIAGGIAAWAAACGSSYAPTAPTQAAATNLSGTWRGTGSDSFSPELVTLEVTQSGTTLSGVVRLRAVDPQDGSCGSCHKVKDGSLSGTISGGAMTLTLDFLAGGNVPAPICEARLNATGTVSNGRITATYAGTDTCEGVYSNGVLDLTR